LFQAKDDADLGGLSFPLERQRRQIGGLREGRADVSFFTDKGADIGYLQHSQDRRTGLTVRLESLTCEVLLVRRPTLPAYLPGGESYEQFFERPAETIVR
jgi:hypothetical protein